jgi:hypothetical protein
VTTPARRPSSLARRTSDSGDTSGFTTKEVALRVEAKLDAFISAHETRHASEAQIDNQARSDAVGTAAGRQLLAAIASVREDLGDHERDSTMRLDALNTAVASHERTIQRLVGAMALIVFLGGGAFILAAIAFIARISGVTV